MGVEYRLPQRHPDWAGDIERGSVEVSGTIVTW